MAWRKKISRKLEIDIDCMDCTCFGPLQLSCEELEKKERLQLLPDEYQTILYQDRDNLTMDVACQKMGISKTVYAGLYKSARSKLACMLDQGCALTICNG